MNQGLVEDHFLEPACHLVPLVTEGQGQALGICLKALVQNADEQERPITTSRRHFAQALECEDVFMVRVHRRVFEQFTQFVDDEQYAKPAVSGALDQLSN